MIADLVREELAALAAYAIPHPTGIRAKLDANESPFPWPLEVERELAAHRSCVPLHRYPADPAGALRAAPDPDASCAPAPLDLGNGSA